MNAAERNWWDEGRTWALFALASTMPFLAVDIPGLVDLPSHIATFHVLNALDRSPYLQSYYGLDLTPVANLGVNLLVMPFIGWVGVERAAWLATAIIPPLTITGIFAVSRTVHRRVPPTALLALPLVYCFAFVGGFVNYALAFAGALFGFAAWVKIADAGWKRRTLVFAPVATILCLAHISGWGVFCLLVGGFELHRSWQRSVSWPSACELMLRILPLATPIVVLLPWTQSGDGATYFHPTLIENKLRQLSMIVRQDVRWFDIATACILIVLPILLVVTRAARPAAQLGVASALLTLTWAATPVKLLGSFYADYRLASVLVMVLALSLGRWRRGSFGAQLLAVAAVGLFVGRLALTTVMWVESDRSFKQHLAALDVVPRGARIVVLTPWACSDHDWRRTPINHLGSYAITRRDAFTNTLWSTPGGHLTRVRYNLDTPFHGDPSQVVRVGNCRGHSDAAFGAALARIPRDRFDFIWVLKSSLVTMPSVPAVTLVYADANSRLYAIDHASSTGRTS